MTYVYTHETITTIKEMKISITIKQKIALPVKEKIRGNISKIISLSQHYHDTKIRKKKCTKDYRSISVMNTDMKILKEIIENQKQKYIN